MSKENVFDNKKIDKRIDELILIEQGFNIAKHEGKNFDTFYDYAKSKQQSENKDYGKPIMFTTDDNVNIFDEEDEVWIVDRYWVKAAYKAAIAFASRYRHSDLKVFSTEEKAEEYIKKHKPILFTTEDGKPIYEGDSAVYVEEDNDFKIVFHGNITKPNNRKYFSTSEAANEYILMNKPCLSANDIKRGFEKYFGYYNGLNEHYLKELVKNKLTVENKLK